MRRLRHAHPHPRSAAATLSQDRSLRLPHYHAQCPSALSSSRTSAVNLVILEFPVVDVAIGTLVDTCSRVTRLSQFSPDQSLTSSPPLPIRSREMTPTCHHIGILVECTRAHIIHKRSIKRAGISLKIPAPAKYSDILSNRHL
jgi:hypothetical protein